MVSKQVENILSNKITREGFWNNGKFYYLGGMTQNQVTKNLNQHKQSNVEE